MGLRLYIGHVKKIDEENQIIDFIIDDLYTDTSEMPKAVPLDRLTKIAQIDDEVLILQPNDQIELYYYLQFRDAYNYVSLEYNKSFIRIFNDGNIIMEAGEDGDGKQSNITITTKKQGNINIDTSAASDGGNITINTKGSKDGKITVNTQGEVNLTVEKGDANVKVNNGNVKIDAKKVEIPCTSVELQGATTIGFCQLTTISHPGGVVTPVSSVPCTALVVKK